jgi:predicted RNA-binding protein YlxR (DUF448 family)
MRSGASGVLRTCAGCGRKAPQGELQPFHVERGELVAGRGLGRGSYTCPRQQCFERAVAGRAFNRILRSNLRIDPALTRLYTGA